MHRILLSLALITIFIFATGCSSLQSSPTQNSLPEILSPTVVDEAISSTLPGYPGPDVPAQIVEQGYPAPDVATQAVEQGYPAPPEIKVTPSSSPTQDHNKGSIKGRLLMNNQPVADAILSFAEVIRDSDGREMVVSYDPASSPTTNTDSQGNFYFKNIDPNKYGLILDTIIKSYLLHYPEEENSQIVILVEKGKEVDLGDLNYDSLPIQVP
jgi:hypothetical protein